MALPIRAGLEDINQTCAYIATKPTGATPRDIAAVVGDTLADSRRISALQVWGLIEGFEDGRYKITEDGRLCGKGEAERQQVLQKIIKRTPAYLAIVERVAHRREDALTLAEVAGHWHTHFREEVSDSEESLKEQVKSFFQIASGAGLGTFIVGRRGAQSRFAFSYEGVTEFSLSMPLASQNTKPELGSAQEVDNVPSGSASNGAASPGLSVPPADVSIGRKGQGIFIAHGKNKKPLDQLEKVLQEFKIQYKVVTGEPNLGRPISTKVRETMESCNCAILIFTADEEFKTPAGETIWRPSENVIFELGAAGLLYDNRLVIMKEEDVSFPTNFSDIGYIPFAKDQLNSKAMEILKELIGFGIVKIST